MPMVSEQTWSGSRPDKHISVSAELHDRIKELAKKQGRSMRGLLELLIKEAEKKSEK